MEDYLESFLQMGSSFWDSSSKAVCTSQHLSRILLLNLSAGELSFGETSLLCQKKLETDTTTTRKLDFWRERALLQTFPVWLKLSQVHFLLFCFFFFFVFLFLWLGQFTEYQPERNLLLWWLLVPWTGGAPGPPEHRWNSSQRSPADVEAAGVEERGRGAGGVRRGWVGGGGRGRAMAPPSLLSETKKERERHERRSSRRGWGGVEGEGRKSETTGVLRERSEWASEWVWWKNQWLCRKETGKESRGGRMKT